MTEHSSCHVEPIADPARTETSLTVLSPKLVLTESNSCGEFEGSDLDCFNQSSF